MGVCSSSGGYYGHRRSGISINSRLTRLRSDGQNDLAHATGCSRSRPSLAKWWYSVPLARPGHWGRLLKPVGRHCLNDVQLREDTGGQAASATRNPPFCERRSGRDGPACRASGLTPPDSLRDELAGRHTHQPRGRSAGDPEGAPPRGSWSQFPDRRSRLRAGKCKLGRLFGRFPAWRGGCGSRRKNRRCARLRGARGVEC